MESSYRIARPPARSRIRHRSATPRGHQLLAVALLLLTATVGYGEGVTEMEHPDAAPGNALPIIVNLAVGQTAGGSAAQTDQDAIAAVRTAVMDRLREVLSAADLAAVRTFEHFPAIALSVSPDVLALLMEMPEVASIERDRELMPLEEMTLDFN